MNQMRKVEKERNEKYDELEIIAENESNIMNMDNFKTGNDGICKIIYITYK